MRESFNSFNDAKKFAAKMSTSSNVSLRYGSDRTGLFFVEIPAHLVKEHVPNEPIVITYDDDNEHFENYYDVEIQEIQQEITSEIWSNYEDQARSDEEGWYYDDEQEGGWENSISSNIYGDYD
jgi:hypothetical protein